MTCGPSQSLQPVHSMTLHFHIQRLMPYINTQSADATTTTTTSI